jgi:hypothetical protein
MAISHVSRSAASIPCSLKRELAERIGLCQRILRRPASQVDELLGLSVEELREQAERLERDVMEKVGPA